MNSVSCGSLNLRCRKSGEGLLWMGLEQACSLNFALFYLEDGNFGNHVGPLAH
jgi:hypothetical protein